MMRDCPREEIWRNHSKENYKSGRPSFSGGNYFKYTYQTIIPSLIENKKINQDIKIFTGKYVPKDYSKLKRKNRQETFVKDKIRNKKFRTRNIAKRKC